MSSLFTKTRESGYGVEKASVEGGGRKVGLSLMKPEFKRWMLPIAPDGPQLPPLRDGQGILMSDDKHDVMIR
jgi:hypothetical protein